MMVMEERSVSESVGGREHPNNEKMKDQNK